VPPSSRDYAWLISSGILSALIVTLGLVVHFSDSPAVATAEPTGPRYEIRRTEPQTLVLPPGGAYIIANGTYEAGRTAAVHIHAMSPVHVGFLAEGLRLDPATLQARAPYMLCGQVNILDATIRCHFDKNGITNSELVIVDARTPVGAAGAGLAALFGVKRPAENFLVRNDVAITSETSVCVANCAQVQH
jgi:hypothetical protein